MQYIYISFEENGLVAKFRPSFFQRVFSKALKLFIPAANPDFEDRIDYVKTWLIEIDGATGSPCREVGLDEKGGVLAIMPTARNHGYWTDNNMKFEDFKAHFNVCEIKGDAFEGYWNVLAGKYNL